MVYLTDNFGDIVRTLEDGGCLLYPTDTIWGIGCSALIGSAIKNIYRIKQRTFSNPFILLVADLDMLKRYVKKIHPRIETLLDYFDRPLTVIYEGAQNLPSLAYSKDGTVGIRIAKDMFCRDLITRLDAPLISTSANLSGEVIPTNFHEINPIIKREVDYVVKFRQNDKTERESSIIVSYDEEGELRFLRT